METQPGARLKSIVDGCLSLKGETYEFISRTVTMDSCLKEAHSLLEGNPQLKADELYQAWQPLLGETYRNLFAVFLRPYRMVIFPFGSISPPAPGRASESVNPLSGGQADNPFYSLWYQAGERFVKGFSEAARQTAGSQPGPAASSPGEGGDDAAEGMLLGVTGQLAEGQMRLWFESAKQLCGLMGDDQMLFPSSLVGHLQRVCDTYPRVFPLYQKYERMLWRSWDSGLKKLARRVTNTERPVGFKAFSDSYVNLMKGEYDALLCSPEFLEVQNGFTEAVSELIVSLRKTIEARMEMLPFLPIVTSSEMTALERTVHSQKRHIDALERRIAELEDRLGTA